MKHSLDSRVLYRKKTCFHVEVESILMSHGVSICIALPSKVQFSCCSSITFAELLMMLQIADYEANENQIIEKK